jgi:hypothetical protein
MKKFWKKIWLKTLAVSRLMVILVLLVALGLSGANAAARLFANCPLETLSADFPSGHKLIVPDAAETEAATDAMAPGSRPYTEQDACLITPVCIKVDKDESHLSKKTYFNVRIGFFEMTEGKYTFPVSSLCLISSYLGRSLTLVGAKPSGTS